MKYGCVGAGCGGGGDVGVDDAGGDDAGDDVDVDDVGDVVLAVLVECKLDVKPSRPDWSLRTLARNVVTTF